MLLASRQRQLNCVFGLMDRKGDNKKLRKLMNELELKLVHIHLLISVKKKSFLFFFHHMICEEYMIKIFQLKKAKNTINLSNDTSTG
jgi:hypothetical protein